MLTLHIAGSVFLDKSLKPVRDDYHPDFRDEETEAGEK